MLTFVPTYLTNHSLIQFYKSGRYRRLPKIASGSRKVKYNTTPYNNNINHEIALSISSIDIASHTMHNTRYNNTQPTSQISQLLYFMCTYCN